MRALAALLLTAAALGGAAAAQARTPALVPDVPSAAHHQPRPAQAQAANVPYLGGTVLNRNRTHLIFWQPAGSGLTFDPGYEQLIETFLNDVAAASHTTTNVYGLTGQYRDAQGPAAYDSTYGGAVVDTDALPANGCSEPTATGPGWSVCLSDAQLQSELERVIAAHGLPDTSDDIYFLVTPNRFGSCEGAGPQDCSLGGSAGGFCGYHSQDYNGTLYAVIPYNAVAGHCQSGNPRPNASTADPTVSTISHEQIETITDPLDDAYLTAQDQEIADLCITRYGPALGGSGTGVWDEDIDGGHFYLQEIWSNDAGGCAAQAPADSVAFAVPRTVRTGEKARFIARANDPEGSVVAYAWSFGTTAHATSRHRALTHIFTRGGTYKIQLRITDSAGNWAFATRTIRVKRG